MAIQSKKRAMGVVSDMRRYRLVAAMALVVLLAPSVHFPVGVRGESSPEEYLAPHNAARAVEGGLPLTWSADLANYARGYAVTQLSQCLPLEHSHGPYGENLFWGSGKEWTAEEAVNLWAAEKVDYDYNTNSCTSGKMCGHYTQIVWKSTTQVGCATLACDNGGQYIICSYDPPGNWVGQRPY